MANTNFVLSKIMVGGELHDIIAKTTAQHTAVVWRGAETTLDSALASIIIELAALPSESGVEAKIGAAISELIGGAPETYDTLKEIADYISAHKEVSEALNQAIGNKVDKVSGKGLSAEDFTSALKTKLESMPNITASQVEEWNGKADKTVATTTANGLMSKEDKARLDSLRGVRFGSEIPADLKDGELFVQVVSEGV